MLRENGLNHFSITDSLEFGRKITDLATTYKLATNEISRSMTDLFEISP